MKAIIMAGGEGTRLRPLTCDCPKPMMQLMNRPVMQYALDLLKKHGITEIAATLGYLPDAIIDYFGDGEDFGVSLKYYIEKTPLGTAGGVRQARDFLDETFIVLSGDGVTDLNISEAVAFHKKRKALATLVLKHEETPLEYGVVSTGRDGRITNFYEKPAWSDVLSDTINTGIYILEPEIMDMIPDARAYDFGNDLFPALVQAGKPIYGYIMEGYWCDIGDIRAYLTAHKDAMEGRIHLDKIFPCPGKVVKMPGAQIDKSAIIEGPCLIGTNARIHAGAYIGPYSVIGRDCVIGESASIKRAILWHGAQMESHAHARGCILGTNAIIGESGQAYEESVLGSGACIGERSVLMPGVKLWPGKHAADGERLDANLVWGNRRPQIFMGGTLPISAPAQATRAAQACACVLQPGELLLGRSSSTVAAAMWHAAAAGAMSQGVQVLDAGICSLPQLRHAQQNMGCKGAALVQEDRLIPLNELGARILSRQQRSIITLNARQDFSGPFTGITRPIIEADQSELSYIAAVAARFSADPAHGSKIAVHSHNGHLLGLAERAFLRAGLIARTEWQESRMDLAPDELGVWLNNTGEGIILSDTKGALSDAHQQLLIAWTALEMGERRLILPVSATRAIDALADRYNAHTEYIAGDPILWMNALAERAPEQFALQFDGIQAALAAISALTNAGLSLSQWKSGMPRVHRRRRTVPVAASETGRILNAFAENEEHIELGGGLRFIRNEGWAWICPDECKPEFRIITESANAEYARELCDFCENRLAELLQK